MDGWMDGWRDGWMDGWTERWMDGWRVCGGHLGALALGQSQFVLYTGEARVAFL